MKTKRIFGRLWLIPGVFLTILLAEMFPHLGSKEGPLNPELTVEYGVVSLINFMSGLATVPGGILRIILHFRVHLFIQCNALIFMPLFVKLMTLLISKTVVDEWVLNGMITLSCLPPPVLCSVVMTRSIQGNKEVAMFNSVLGNLLGIFVSPLMMLLLVRSTSLIPLVSTIVQMVLTVLVPMLAGEMVGWLFGFQDMYIPVLNTLSELALLVTLFTMYCQTFEQTDMDLDAHAVLSSITLVVILLLVATFLVFTVASHLPGFFQPEEVIAILFCSTHKSLTLGIPLLHAMYGGYSHYKTISLPLLVYYPSQVIVACLLSIPLTQWMKLQHRKRAALD